jgi:hypothetical protein
MAQTSGTLPALSDNVKKAGEKPNRFTEAMRSSTVSPVVRKKPNMAARRAAARARARGEQ